MSNRLTRWIVISDKVGSIVVCSSTRPVWKFDRSAFTSSIDSGNRTRISSTENIRIFIRSRRRISYCGSIPTAAYYIAWGHGRSTDRSLWLINTVPTNCTDSMFSFVLRIYERNVSTSDLSHFRIFCGSTKRQLLERYLSSYPGRTGGQQRFWSQLNNSKAVRDMPSVSIGGY